MGAIKVFVFLCVAASCYCEALRNVGINGGYQITIEDAPFMASVRLGKEIHWCGGSIIHERFILTAAHCIKPNTNYNIMVGSDVINGGGGKYYEIEDYIFHEKYNSTSFDFDVCLIKLSTPLKLDKKVKIIELADRDISLPTGILLNMTGWGQPKIEDLSNNLLQVSVPVVSRYDCQEFYKTKEINENMVCAGGKRRNVSFGDTGGPLTLGEIQVGVSSFGRGHGKVPSVYIKIRKVFKWIRLQILKNLNE